MDCHCGTNAELQALLKARKQKAELIMLDCLSTDTPGVWGTVRRISEFHDSKQYIALFNYISDQPVGNDLVRLGVRGVFYEDDSIVKIAKGIQAILNGELWFSRETLMKYLTDSSETSKLNQDATGFLTIREKEILVMIASGGSNSQIADDLGISPNTVKTHIYNIYSKIKVPNRLQAALWAAKNF